MAEQTCYNKQGILLEGIVNNSANGREMVGNSIKAVFNAMKGSHRGSDKTKSSMFTNLLSNLLRYESYESSFKKAAYLGIRTELVDEISKNRNVKKYWINQIFLIRYEELRNFFDGGLEAIFDADYYKKKDLRLDRPRDMPLKAQPYRVRQEVIIFRELSHFVNKYKRFMGLGNKEAKEANKQFIEKIRESKEFTEKTDFLIMSYFNLAEDYKKFSEDISFSNYKRYCASTKKMCNEVSTYLKNTKDDQIKFLRAYFDCMCNYYLLRMSYELVSNEHEKLKSMGSETISILLGEASVLSLIKNPYNVDKKNEKEKYLLFERVRPILPKLPQYLMEYHADPAKLFREKGLIKK